jgi:hypothetical protein
MQELSSAKYYQESAAAAPAATPATRRQAAPPPPEPSGLERLCRYVAPVAAGLLVVGGAATLWLNRSEIAENARYVDQRTGDPFNLVLFLGGSDKTFEDVWTDAIQTGLAEVEEMPVSGPLEFNTDFDFGKFQGGLPQNWSGSFEPKLPPKRTNKSKKK